MTTLEEKKYTLDEFSIMSHIHERQPKINIIYETMCRDIDLLFEKYNTLKIENLLHIKTHPLIGFHSTDFKSLFQILTTDSFNSDKEDCPQVMFTMPFAGEYADHVSRDSDYFFNSNESITFTNGITRVMRELKNRKPDDAYVKDSVADPDSFYNMGLSRDYVVFPIIVTCFSDDDNIKLGTWIQSNNTKNNTHIIGFYIICLLRTDAEEYENRKFSDERPTFLDFDYMFYDPSNKNCLSSKALLFPPEKKFTVLTSNVFINSKVRNKCDKYDPMPVSEKTIKKFTDEYKDE